MQDSLLDIIDQIILILDLDSVITYRNRAAVAFYGDDDTTAVGRKIKEPRPADPLNFRDLVFVSRMGQKKVWTEEVTLYRADGVDVPMLMTVSPMFQDGVLVGTTIVATDITTKKQAYSQLEYRGQRLKYVSDLGTKILGVQKPEMIAQTALDYLQLLIPNTWVGITLIDPSTRKAIMLSRLPKSNDEFTVGGGLPPRQTEMPDQDATSRVYFVTDLEDLPESEANGIYKLLNSTAMRSYISVPLTVENELVGGLFLAAEKTYAFSAEDLDVAQEIAEPLAIAIQTSQLFIENERYATDLEKRVEERTREVSALGNIAAVLNSTLDFQEILERILSNMGRVVAHDIAHILLIESGVTRVVRCRGYADPEDAQAVLDQRLFVREIGTLRWMAEHKDQLVINDVQQYSEEIDIPRRPWLRSYVGAPICFGDEVIGFLNLGSTVTRFFTPADAGRLKVFADQAAIALQNALMYEKAAETAILVERERLSNELHDEVNQTLWSAKLIAGILPSIWEDNAEEGRRQLAKLQQLLGLAQEEMRSLLLELRPDAMLELELAQLLKRLIDVASGRDGITIVPLIEGNVPLKPDVKLALYRMAQEAISNAVRHSEATHITLELRSDSQQLVLRVSDNGRGFSPEQPMPGHFGLRGLHDRAHTIGASLTIESQPGQGTAISILLPIKPD